jgi:CelD/BcsL family acetyltransferase involved in cellulose biosynthesis
VNRLRVEEARGTAALQALRAEWQALFAAANSSLFLSWEWMAAWQAAFGAQLTPRLFCARAGNQLVGLLALAEEEMTPLGLPVRARRLVFLGEGPGGADYLDVLIAPGYERAAAEAICGYLARSGSFDVLELAGLAEDSPSLPILSRWFGSGEFRYRSALRHDCPQLEISGTWEEVLKGSHRATNFKRRHNALRKLDGFERRVLTTPEETAAAFERFLALHEKRWAAQGGSDAMGQAALKAFHRELVPRLAAAGLLRFEELWAEGGCRASIYGIQAGSRFYYYQAGYDPDWAKQSVGLTLLGLSIQDAVGRGVQTYDFLRGTESYKFDWATRTRRTVTVTAARRNLSAQLFLARARARSAARAVAQAALPERAVECLRRWRRVREQRAGLSLWTQVQSMLGRSS